ncbi:hypothetical protein D9756_011264 [Leucocoprinus leucothites]|uniref:Uncharacterized protein n=1 Tax=Leucocoprinus leucothites TaxID=201217 RepID=A0A8H5CSJ2_9AGAR|nr:hypothetical protein D9756_011264 [Leucoagaricus leucothites]
MAKKPGIRSKSKYAIKRTFGRYYPICPASRNQVSVNAQTCKRLKSFLGEACETLQLQPMGIQSRKMMSRRRLTVPQIKYVHRKDGDEPEVGSLNSSTRLSAPGIIITVLFLYHLQCLITPAIYFILRLLLFW